MLPDHVNSFLIIKEKTTGNVTVTKNSQYNDMDADVVVIEENVSVRIFGDIKALVVLNKGSHLYLHGKIPARLENNGGTLHVFPR